MKNTSSQKVPERRLRMALMCLVFFIRATPCWIMTGCGKDYDRTEQEQTKENDSDRSNEDNSDKDGDLEKGEEVQKKTLVLGTEPTVLETAKARRQEAAAATLQALARGRKAKKEFVENKAATKIQTAYRGYDAKNKAAEDARAVAEAERQAAAEDARAAAEAERQAAAEDARAAAEAERQAAAEDARAAAEAERQAAAEDEVTASIAEELRTRPAATKMPNYPRELENVHSHHSSPLPVLPERPYQGSVMPMCTEQLVLAMYILSQGKRKIRQVKEQPGVTTSTLPNQEEENTKRGTSATRLQAAYRGYLARNTKKTRKKEEALRQSEEERQRQEAAIKIQTAYRGYDAKNKAAEDARAVAEAERQAAAEPKKEKKASSIIELTEVVAPASTAAETKKKTGAEKSEAVENTELTENESDNSDFDVVDKESYFDKDDNAIQTSTNIPSTDRLPSWVMRKVIKQLGLLESKNKFESGGLTKPTFFYGEDSKSGKKTYIALAYNRDSRDLEAQCGGEQSISTVLKNIKEDLAKNNNRNNNREAEILIPLQQIGKKHWTLLAITLTKKDAPSEHSEYTVEATHYDSKGLLNQCRDFTSEGRKYVNEQVKNHFLTEVNYKYEGTQGLFDSHNCGRYTLTKLLALINPEENPKTIEDINRMINAK